MQIENINNYGNPGNNNLQGSNNLEGSMWSTSRPPYLGGDSPTDEPVDDMYIEKSINRKNLLNW